ncbi:hypothetical protein TRICI_000250 [Trichomonascus ciferrii]|uniref:Thiamine transporter n=1 Tax=Trichomonascus ciferrii TaxID=44093 RepID=A0A642VDV6_9ASCO|nr:hypothetical protein TRICI_000250 [Trichomonascus ciferrii]
MPTKILKWLEVAPESGPNSVSMLKNRDIVPMPPSRRIWGIFSYIGYWGTSNFCASTWTGASSLLSLGLNVPQAMGVIVVANAFSTCLAVINAWPGSKWHIGYTISQRVIFGIYGSNIGILVRVILSIVWFGSQSWLGGLCVTAIISSWSKNYLNMKNTFPESVHMTSRDLIGFLIFQIILIPCLCFKPEKWAKPIIITSITTFFGMLGTCIWACTDNGSAGPLMDSSVGVKGSALAWAWVNGITSWYGSQSAGITNQSDFTRFSKRKYAAVPGTIFALMVNGTIVPLFGVLAASATLGKYGTQYWNPIDITMLWLETDYTPKARAGAFFAALSFLGSQLSLNVIGNGFAGGMDMAGLFPRYINIRRGALATALLSWVVQPWTFYNTSSTFLAVMGSFSVFMAPMIGVIISDFFFVRKRRLVLSHLYTSDPDGTYYYWRGFNFRGILTWVVVFTPALPGLITSANPNIPVNDGIYKYYQGNLIFGFFEALVLYKVICLIWPVKNAGEQDPIDYFGTFTTQEAEKMGIVPYERYREEEEHIDGSNVELVTEDIDPIKN